MTLLEEGSGLSRGCLGDTQRLGAIVDSTWRIIAVTTIFYNALPIAGVDGTLRSRFKAPPPRAMCVPKPDRSVMLTHFPVT